MIKDDDFNLMIEEAKQISISDLHSAEVGMFNLHIAYLGEYNKKFNNEVRSQMSKLYQVTDEMIKILAKSILHRKSKVFFPVQELEGWSIDVNNIDEIMKDYSKYCNNPDICKELYDDNIHIFRALHAGLLKLTELMVNEYDELEHEHRFHDEFYDDCEDCQDELIDVVQEMSGLNHDYITMCS